LKGCSVSIPSNISEGAGRATNAQFKYFLEISMGSSNEAITQIELAFLLNFITREMKESLIDAGFYNSLQ